MALRWAELAEYCYRKGEGTPWNFDGWLAELLFKEGEEWRLRFEGVKRIIEKINPSSCVLDLMCGGAYPSRWLAERYPRCFVVGIDLDRRALLFAKQRVKKGLKNIDFVRCDVYKLPFKGKVSDLTFVIGGLEHVDLAKALSEVKRVTKKWFIATFTGRNIRRRLYYRLGLVHLRFAFSSKFPRFFELEEIKKLFNCLSRESTICKCGKYNIIAFANLETKV